MEEITTIFVVGFPDDMNEREFQNMFIFNPGFEAATLKIPTPNKDGRKQIIGFAKFHTKMDALNAMEVLTGRQIDFEKGSVLKAEMAKKNLHTKKTMMNMYYPASSMKNTCMQYHSMMPDNVNNCMNFNNNNNMVNNLCNQLIKDDSNVYQINNMNRGMNLPTSTGIGPLTNNGPMLPGARERNGNMNLLNSATTQPFIDQNSSLFNTNRNMYKLPNYQNLDMNHSNSLNSSKPSFEKLYKNIPGTTNGTSIPTNNNSLLFNNNLFNFLADNSNAPKGLKQQTMQNNLFSFNNSLQKPMQQSNSFSANANSFMNGVYRQPSSLLDNDFSGNNNHSTGAPAVGQTTAVTNKFSQNSGNLSSVESPFSNDLYNNNFNLPINYLGGNNDLLKNRASLNENTIDGSPIDDLKKVSPLSTSSTTPLFFSPINKTSGFMDLNNNNNNNSSLDNINGKPVIDSTNDLNSKFYNLSLNMAMDKSTIPSSKDDEVFDNISKDNQKITEKSKEDLEFSNTNDFVNNAGTNSILKNNFTFNLFSNENSSSLLDTLGKNDSFGLISKLSSSSMNLPFKKDNFNKMSNSLNDKDIEVSLQSNEESSSTINSNTINNAKINNLINNGSDFTLNEGNADNKTEPELSIFSSLTNLTSEPIIPPPQVYSSNIPSITTEDN